MFFFYLFDEAIAENAEEEHLGKGVEEVTEDGGGVGSHTIDLSFFLTRRN